MRILTAVRGQWDQTYPHLNWRWLWSMVLGIMIVWQGPVGAITDPPVDAAQLFEVHCVGCHPGGGNIIRRGKTLKLRALKRNHMDSVAAIADLVTHGKNNMSAYRDQLTEAEITAISTYVWDQAQHNWR